MSMNLTIDRSVAEKYATNPGNREHTLYIGKVNENGVIDLIENGIEDIQDKINSYAESTDMQVIIRRFLSGEVDVLSKVQGFYADVTTFPRTYAEFMQRQIDAQNIFMSLPADVRAQFDNDVSKFLATAGDDSWFAKVGIKRQDMVSAGSDQTGIVESAPSEGVSK